jgi:hypothetical protein
MTVLVARAAAGFASGIVGIGLGSADGRLWWLALPLVATVVAGLVLPGLLASISGRTIGYAKALGAAAAGEALPVVIALPHTQGGLLTVGIVLVGWVASVVVMTWVVEALSASAATEPAAS